MHLRRRVTEPATKVTTAKQNGRFEKPLKRVMPSHAGMPCLQSEWFTGLPSQKPSSCWRFNSRLGATNLGQIVAQLVYKRCFFEFAKVRSMIGSCSRESKSLLEYSIESVPSYNLWSKNLTLGGR
jgi:hypothetical protein